MTQTLLHVLAVEPPEGTTILARCSVRSGTVRAGNRLWFADAEGVRRELEVRSVQPSSRWLTIVFSGRPEDLPQIVTGTYLRTAAAERRPPLALPGLAREGTGP